jgi:hypothetical protein
MWGEVLGARDIWYAHDNIWCALQRKGPFYRARLHQIKTSCLQFPVREIQWCSQQRFNGPLSRYWADTKAMRRPCTVLSTLWRPDPDNAPLPIILVRSRRPGTADVLTMTRLLEAHVSPRHSKVDTLLARLN